MNHVHHRKTFNEPSRKEQNIQNYPLFCANMWPKLLFRLCKPSVLNRICISKYVVFVCFDVRKRQGECTFVFPKYAYTSLLLNQTKTKRKWERDREIKGTKQQDMHTPKLKGWKTTSWTITDEQIMNWRCMVSLISSVLGCCGCFSIIFFLKSKRFFVLFTQKTCHLLEN